ncbi:MAG TPA: helix-turn-helix domain-containing protein [Solirubrobacteraceae bacterium]
MTAVRVSDFDPELFEQVSDPDAAAAASVAESEWLEVGPWSPANSNYDGAGHFGIILLEGTVLRRVALGPRDGLELLGPGDVGRPWVTLGPNSTIGAEADWRVHQRARIAHLDRRFAMRVSPWPEVAAALMDRLIRRQRFLAIHLAVSQMPRLESRLRVLFWYLADRWGKVTGDGIVINLPLTHELVAGLVGARRPGVTSALGELQRDGELFRRQDGCWVLRGAPPPELRATA